MTNYFNDLRDHGIEIIQKDTCWIDIFCRYVLEKKLISHDTLCRTLQKTLKVLSKGQTTKDVIDLLRKFNIDYSPIDKIYNQRKAEWDAILSELD